MNAGASKFTYYVGDNDADGSAMVMNSPLVVSLIAGSNTFQAFVNGTQDIKIVTIGKYNVIPFDVLLAARRQSSNNDVGYTGRVEIAEIIIYPAQLSEAQRQAVELFLTEKWITGKPLT